MRKVLRKIAGHPRLYSFFLNIRPLLGRNIFLLICAGSLIWYNFFSLAVIERLKNQTISATLAYADLIETTISGNMDQEKTKGMLKGIIEKSGIPVVLTDSAFSPLIWNSLYTGMIFKKELPCQDLSEWQRRFLTKKIDEFRKTYEPRPLSMGTDGQIAGYLVFGNTRLINLLRLMPFMEVGLIAALLVLAYIAFHNIRTTERSNLWVGLAKETAHQLGTPISSLMGWIEYMRTVRDEESSVDPELFIGQINKICDDMDNDLKRLRKVTARFSQIGSIPALRACDIHEVICDVADYFQMRLPLLRKKILIQFDFGDIPHVAANRELLEWVFENLMKNSVDAIDRNDGKITIRTEYLPDEKIVRIQHGDNGKGISWEAQKKIFAPGYTTKKRGWGLGLTLAKRIIEDYHSGNIHVSWSAKGKGSVFCVDLPVHPGKKSQVSCRE